MDKFLGAFSLQNFLRQFFCGVVFLVPFFLYETPLEQWLVAEGDIPIANLVRESDWSSAKATALGVLACIVGTIIYHLEKNIYSYAMQSLFEFIAEKSNRNYWITALVPIGGIVAIIIMLLALLFAHPDYHLLLFFIIVIFAAVITIVACCNAKLKNRTRRQWVAECMDLSSKDDAIFLTSYVLGFTSQIPSAAIPLIAARISKWSDFIHCVQSCCFSFLFGSILVQKIIGQGLDWKYQMLTPLCILLFEAIFDWHRYQHVLAITGRMSELHSDTQYEVTIENLQYIVTVKQKKS